MTFLELQTECYDRLRIPTPDATITALVKRMVNNATRKASTYRNWPWMETSVSLSISSSTRAYTLGATCGFILNMHDSNGVVLNEVSRDTYFDMYRGDATTGSPTVFCVDGMDTSNLVTVQVWPVPTGSATLTVRCRRRVADLSSDGDIPNIPTQYHYALVSLAAAMVREWEGGQDWQPLMQLAMSELNQMDELEFGQRVPTPA